MSAQETKGSQTLKYAFLGLVLLQTVAMAVFAFARLGNFRHMPDPLQRLAIKVRNSTVPREVPVHWEQLCRAWASWLPFLQRDAPRLLRTEGLLGPNDPLRAQLVNFLANAKEFRPEILVPEAAAEKNLRVLAESPSDSVLNELGIMRVNERVSQADRRIQLLRRKLENWPRWNELRTLLKFVQDRHFTQVESALQSRLPPEHSSPGSRVNTVRTLKFLNDLSLDDSGLLRLLSRWSEFSRFAADMQASANPELKSVTGRLLNELTDQPTLSEFADSLVSPLEEMRRRSGQSLVPGVQPDTKEQDSTEALRALAPIRRS